MDFASSTKAAETRIRWKGIVVKSCYAPMIFQGYWKEKKKKNRQSEVLIR